MDIEVVRTDTPRKKPDPDNLGFGRSFSDHMFLMDFGPDEDSGWHSPRIVPYANLSMAPSASSLHYGQTIFEGLKAFRGDDGKIRLFRPDKHAARFDRSAERLCIPPLPKDVFLEACKRIVKEDVSWVPSSEGASLYIRPFIFATEPFLGVRPAVQYTFAVITSPVGAYYATGFAPVRILVEREEVRAAPGGTGAAKTAANYAASLHAATKAKKAGYAQVLWTDAREHRFIEEVGTMNVFFRLDNEVVTPALDGTILPGVTRDSVIALLRRRGTNVVERSITLDEVKEAHAGGKLIEAFGTGTAAVVSPISHLGIDGADIRIGNGDVGPMAQALFDEIVAIQRGRSEDKDGWTLPVA